MIGFMTLATVFANNDETLLRKTDTCDIDCFLYTSLSRISKAETVERTLLQMDNFFQFSNKKATWPHADPNKHFRNSEEQIIKLNIFVNFRKKKHIFLTLRQPRFLLISFSSFKGVRYFLSRTLYFFSKLPSAVNQ